MVYFCGKKLDGSPARHTKTVHCTKKEAKFKLDKIKPTDIMKFYDMLENDTQIKRLKNNKGERLKKPLSRKTILEHHRLLRAMLHKAVYWQLLVNNLAERVQPPKVNKPKKRYYDDEQCKFLLEHLEQLIYKKYKIQSSYYHYNIH